MATEQRSISMMIVTRKELLRVRVTWQDMDGVYHNDWFVTPKSARAKMDVSYVHVWNDVREGLVRYLAHLPLMSVEITDESNEE